jgi:hypothetical protein
MAINNDYKSAILPLNHSTVSPELETEQVDLTPELHRLHLLVRSEAVLPRLEEG